MKAFMKVTRNRRFWEKPEHVEPTEELEEFKTGMKDVLDWRARYERVMRSSSNVTLRALDFASASQDLAKSLDEAFGSTLKKESPDFAAVYDKLGRIEAEIANLFQQYSAHVAQAITIPTETLLNELQKIEEEKVICDDSRENFDQHRVRVANLKPRNGAKVAEASDEELQLAQDAYDEHAMALGCHLLTLEQKRPRNLFSQAANFHSAQVKLFGAGLQAVKLLEAEIRELLRKKNVDRHIYFRDDGYCGEAESESPCGGASQAYDWEGERDHRSNVSSTPMSPTGGSELRDLTTELPSEWNSVLSSLDSRLADMGERTLNTKDKVFAVNAIMAAASDFNKSKPGRGSLSWAPSNHHPTSLSAPSSVSKSAPLSSAGNTIEAQQSYENSPPLIPSVSGTSSSRPLPSQAPARQPSSKSWSQVPPLGMSSQPAPGSGVALPAQPNNCSSGGSSMSMPAALPPQMSATLLGNSISGPLPPHGRSVTPPPGASAAMPLPEPESVMERNMLHAVTARSMGSRQGSQNSVAALSSRRLWQSGPLTLGGGKAPGAMPATGGKRVTGFPLPTEGQVRSESPLRGRPHRSPPMSPPPVSVSEVHRLPPPPADVVNTNTTNVSPPERLPSHVAHSAPLAGHAPPATSAMSLEIPPSAVGSGSGSASPLPPPPGGNTLRGWPTASAVIATQKNKEHVKLSRPSRGTSSVPFVAVDDKDEPVPLPTGNGHLVTSSRGTSPKIVHRPRRSLSFGGAPGEEVVLYSSESPDASLMTRRHSGPLPPGSPPQAVAPHTVASSPLPAMPSSTPPERPDLQGALNGLVATRENTRFVERVDNEPRWQWLEEASPGVVPGFPEWSTLGPEQKDSFLQILAHAVVNRRGTFEENGDNFSSSRPINISDGYQAQGAVFAGY